MLPSTPPPRSARRFRARSPRSGATGRSTRSSGRSRTQSSGGRFGDGERLPNERDLCRQFEVSRPTLREALRTLEVLGILDIRPGKSGGIFVAAPSGDSVGSVLAALIRLRGASAAELNEFRTSFEGETAACAARRAERDDVERLSRIAADACVAAERRETRWRDMVEADIKFHEAVAHASKNEVRVAVMLGIIRALQRIELTISSIADVALYRRDRSRAASGSTTSPPAYPPPAEPCGSTPLDFAEPA